MDPTYSIIRNCLNQGACARSWDSLKSSELQELTDTHQIRYCDECKNEVHLAESPEKLIQFLEFNFCVAIPWFIDKDGQVQERSAPMVGAFKLNATDSQSLKDVDSDNDFKERIDRLTNALPKVAVEVPEFSDFLSLMHKYLSLESYALEKIQEKLAMSHQGAKGYGGQIEAAELAATFFGVGWTDPSPEFAMDAFLRVKLRRVLKDAAPAEHSNVYVIWQRFQKNAAASAT